MTSGETRAYRLFLEQLEEITDALPWESLGLGGDEVCVLVDSETLRLYTLSDVAFYCGADGTPWMAGFALGGGVERVQLCPEYFLSSLVACIGENGGIDLLNQTVVSDLMLKNTKAFTEAVRQDSAQSSKKSSETKQESTQPTNYDQRPFWMP